MGRSRLKDSPDTGHKAKGLILVGKVEVSCGGSVIPNYDRPAYQYNVEWGGVSPLPFIINF